MTNQEITHLIQGVYKWFNKISDPGTSFNKNDLKQYFTPDFIMEMNDQIITWDEDSLFNHFEKFRKSGYKLEVQLPLQEVVVADDHKKCVARYHITKKSPDQKLHLIRIIAIWHLSGDQRFKRMNEVVHFAEGISV